MASTRLFVECLQYNARNNDWFYIWNKVFRADIIYANKLSFCNDVSLGEDLIFVSNYLQYAENLIYVDEKYAATRI